MNKWNPNDKCEIKTEDQNMKFEMIYDEEEIKIAMSKNDLGAFSKMYHYLQDIYPIKLKILKMVKCHECGFCCKSCNVMLSNQDIDSLCKYLQCSFEELYEKYMDKNTRTPYLKLPCPFSNKDNGCDVYPVRPKPCKEFPFNEFTLVVDPCPLGKDIRRIVEEIEGPITQTNEELQKFADESDEFFGHIINREQTVDTGKNLRLNVNNRILKRIMGYLKHKKKNIKKNNIMMI